MERVINCGDVQVRMRASALIPRLYRFKFGRDMIRDLTQLRSAYRKVESLQADATEDERTDAQLSVLDLTIFENLAYIMAKNADPEVPDSPDEWLDSLPGVFDIYGVLPQILEMWQLSSATTSVPKKKRRNRPVKRQGRS